MCVAAELEKCPYEGICCEQYPSYDRSKCSGENCEFCPFYWDFLTDNLEIDDE